MIRSSTQLKALVRNMAKGDSAKAQVIFRSYAMGRFLERLSLSPYRSNVILKGGALVAAMVGIESRSTLDLDATITNLPLSIESAQRIVLEIISIPLEDGMSFAVTDALTIMDESEYGGVRVLLDTSLETLHTPLKVDFSTGDAITPNETEYSYPLLFEQRTISILAYNLESVLAEKIETLLARGVANTRMRDYYDLYALQAAYGQTIDIKLLHQALMNTSRNRGSLTVISDASTTLREVRESPALKALWAGYQRRYEYAASVSWEDLIAAIAWVVQTAQAR